MTTMAAKCNDAFPLEVREAVKDKYLKNNPLSNCL